MHRSLETLAGAFLVIVGVVFLALANIIISTMLILPLMVWFRARQGRYSVPARAAESLAWAELLTVLTIVVSVVGMGVASVYYEPVSSFFKVPPTPASAGIAVLSFVSVLLRAYLERLWCPRVVAQ